MAMILEYLRGRDLVRDIALSFALIVVVLLLRAAVLRFVQRKHSDWDRSQLRVTVQVKRLFLIVMLLGLLGIWGSELRTLALSFVAIAVAVVIATKELLLCVMGALLRASARTFTIGDRIELQGGIRGDVIDYGLLATTILEIGPGQQWTGRALSIPNSLILTSPVINETFSEPYVLHLITVPLAAEQDWRLAEQRLLAAAKRACADYLSDAREQISAESTRHGLPSPSVEPKVILQVIEPDKVNLLLRLPCRTRDKGDTEQEILRRFLSEHEPFSIPCATSSIGGRDPSSSSMP